MQRVPAHGLCCLFFKHAGESLCFGTLGDLMKHFGRHLGFIVVSLDTLIGWKAMYAI